MQNWDHRGGAFAAPPAFAAKSLKKIARRFSRQGPMSETRRLLPAPLLQAFRTKTSPSRGPEMLIPFPAPEPETINFGELPPEIDALLQKGVVAYRRDFVQAEQLFREALAAGPEELPTYYCLYKIHTYHGNLDEARAAAQTGMRKAARQAGWPDNWREWVPQGEHPRRRRTFRALYVEGPRLHPSAPRRKRARPKHSRRPAQARPNRRGRLAGDRRTRGRTGALIHCGASLAFSTPGAALHKSRAAMRCRKARRKPLNCKPHLPRSEV